MEYFFFEKLNTQQFGSDSLIVKPQTWTGNDISANFSALHKTLHYATYVSFDRSCQSSYGQFLLKALAKKHNNCHICSKQSYKGFKTQLVISQTCFVLKNWF